MHSKRVLLVDSDDISVRLVMRALRGAGYDVIQAGSCGAARSLEARFETGIFTFERGDVSGIELAGEMLARGTVRRVVFHASTRSAPETREALRIGFVVYKGASSEDLIDAVRGAARPVSHIPPSIDTMERSGSGAR